MESGRIIIHQLMLFQVLHNTARATSGMLPVLRPEGNHLRTRTGVLDAFMGRGRFGFHLLNKSHQSNPASQELPFLSFPFLVAQLCSHQARPAMRFYSAPYSCSVTNDSCSVGESMTGFAILRVHQNRTFDASWCFSSPSYKIDILQSVTLMTRRYAASAVVLQHRSQGPHHEGDEGNKMEGTLNE